MRLDLYDRSMSVGSFYHVYNRGVAKGDIFVDERDYEHFLTTLSFYLDDENTRLAVALRNKDTVPLKDQPAKNPLAVSHCYCLMPNHFHLLLEEVAVGGISRLLRRALISYTRYFNTRHHRVGPLFQGNFRFVQLAKDEQFLHVTRYIHLNPYVARMISDPEAYQWSSYRHYMSTTITRLCNPTLALQLAGSPEDYQKFLTDFAGYARDISLIKDHAFDEH